MIRKRLLPAVLVICVLSSLSCEKILNHRSLKLAHGLPVDHPVHKSMEFMAERCAAISDGKLRIDIYPNEQLGREREAVELLQIGSIAITKVSAAVLENFAPKLRVLGLPYIWRDRQHQFDVLDGPLGELLLEAPSDYRLRGLCFYDAGFRSFYTTNKAVRSPEDLSGLKIRVQKSKTATDMVNILGGSATPIDWGELYSALQQGVVDGAENNPPSLESSRHYEICKYYTLNEHTAVPDVLLISTRWWELLSEQEREWLMAAVKESVAFERIAWAEAEQKSLEKIKAAGVEIIYPDKTPFLEKLSGTFEQYRSEPELYDLIQKIQTFQPDSTASLRPLTENR
ncbi:MAG: TRAP transporter substrate-binding protein [Bacteroidia bacterium]|nr:TRAP transporter substrate-binding protein [Bacteroidia bacterium]